MSNFVPIDVKPNTDVEGVKVVGDYVDRIYKNGRLVDTIQGHNIVVDSFLILTMLLMKKEAGYEGIQYWAVGSGADAWDNTLPEPTRDETELVNEVGRVLIDPEDISFLDANYNETEVPTNILKIEAHFSSTDANGKWREFGLFGGNATAAANSGIMIDKRNHKLITKTEDMTIDRTLRLSIQFA